MKIITKEKIEKIKKEGVVSLVFNVDKQIRKKSLFDSFSFRYLVALTTSVFLVLLRVLLNDAIGSEYPFLFAPFAIIISALVGGFFPGIFSTLMTGVLVGYFYFSFNLTNLEGVDLTRSLIFGIEGILISSIVSAVKKSRDLIYNEKEWFRVALSSIGDGVIATNKEGRIIFINKIAKGITGWGEEANNNLLKKVFKIVDNSGKIINPIYQEIIDTGTSLESEKTTNLIRKKGNKVPIDTNIAPIWGAENEMLGSVIVFRDASEKKALEEKKKQFMKTVHHELKTPLSSLKANLQILDNILKEEKNENGKIYLKKVSSYTKRLQNLIETLLTYSKIEEKRLNLSKTFFNIDFLVEETVKDVSKMSSNRRAIKIKGKTNQIINADKEKVEQVLINFLSNAIKFSPNKQKIIVNLQRKNGSVIVGVKDYGIGISKDKQKLIFNRYSRLEDRNFSGFGIGLHVAKKIMEMHNGKIWMESETNKGSSFYFSLPVKESYKKE